MASAGGMGANENRRRSKLTRGNRAAIVPDDRANTGYSLRVPKMSAELALVPSDGKTPYAVPHAQN